MKNGVRIAKHISFGLVSLITMTFAIMLFTIGCNKGSGDLSEQAQNQGAANGNAAINNATYGSACTSSTIHDIGPLKFPGVQTLFELSSLDFTKHIIYYTDADCKTIALEIREKGTLHVTGKSAVVAGALDEDFNYNQTTLVARNDAVISGFNLFTLCGINNWANGTDQDISAKAGGITCPFNGAPRKTADIVLVQNNQLTLGADADQDATKARPTQIDTSKVYTKQ